MGCGLKFHLTGSNIYKILSTLGDVDDRFFQFSYTDMLLMRDGSHPWLKGVSDEELVEITKSLKDIITPRIYKLTLDTFIDRNNSVPDEFKTKWSKLLSDVNQNQSQLTPLIQSLFGEYDGDFNEMFLNLNVRSDVPMNVSVMFCNTRNQEEQKKLVNLTQSILGDKYVVQVLNSNETSNKKCEDKVSKKVSWCKKNNKKLVLITKDMGSRSFSIPELDTVFLLFDGGDLGVVSQKVSRVLTPGHTYNDEKKKCAHQTRWR